MGFGNFGIVSSTNESRVAKFVDYLEQGKLMGTKCTNCGTRYFPPQMECSKCMANTMEWIEVNPNNKLVTYTIVRYGPAGFEKIAPYVIAIGESPEGQRVLGLLSKDIPESDIKVGMKLKLTPVKLEGGRTSYEFQKG